jgi:signal peptidase
MERKKNKSSSKAKKEQKSNKKIILAVIIISFAFFGSFITYFILQVALNTPNPMVVVISGSMEPNIHKGDLLFLRGVDNPADIRNGSIENKDGDVIVYDARGLWVGAPVEPIVHRVVNNIIFNESGYFFWTKGDANFNIDPAPIPANHIIGVVVGGIPYIGWVKIFLTDSGLLIPIIAILSFLLVISIIWDFIKGEEKDSKKSREDEKLENHEDYDF